MAFAPIAAQANTRAGDSGATYSLSAVAQPGMARTIDGSALGNSDDDDDDEGGLIGLEGILAGLLGGAIAIGIIILIDDETDQSLGT
jgi:hypothetical protein